jgi:hypothetical protein
MQNCIILGHGATLPPDSQNKIILGSPVSTLYAAGALGVSYTNTEMTIPPTVGLSINSSLGSIGQVLMSTGQGLTWGGLAARTITSTGELTAPLASLYVSTASLTATLPASANGITVYFKNLAAGALTIASTNIYAKGSIINNSIIVPAGGQVGLSNDGTNWCQIL